jgi:hypothetical protein
VKCKHHPTIVFIDDPLPGQRQGSHRYHCSFCGEMLAIEASEDGAHPVQVEMSAASLVPYLHFRTHGELAGFDEDETSIHAFGPGWFAGWCARQHSDLDVDTPVATGPHFASRCDELNGHRCILVAGHDGEHDVPEVAGPAPHETVDNRAEWTPEQIELFEQHEALIRNGGLS